MCEFEIVRCPRHPDHEIKPNTGRCEVCWKEDCPHSRAIAA